MKHLLILGMFLASFFTHAQHYTTNHPDLINPIYEKIVQRGLNEGIEVDRILEGRLISIQVVKVTPRNAAAEVQALSRVTGVIYIAEYATVNPEALEWLLAHEMSHIIGVPHCCQDTFCTSIMSESTTINPRDLLYPLHKRQENWTELFSHRNWRYLQTRLCS